MKRSIKQLNIITLISILLLSTEINAQSFYDINTIQKIEIEFEQSNWDYLLDTAKAGSESYIMAKSVTVNGTEFDSVGVKYKGNSTYQANQIKNPFHIELDTYKNQDYQGYKDIKLSNVAKDPSFLREVLSYSILRNYMIAPLSNYANVYVNGKLLGLYVSSEAIGKTFVNTFFNSKVNPFFKCNPVSGAGPGTKSIPNLVYLGDDSSNYTSAYEIKSEYGWKELIELCNTLQNNVSEIENILDVDRALWMLAFDNLTVNLDSYIGGFAQNYYLYKDNTGRFSCILWDFNEGFGTFSQTGTINLQNTSSKSQMTHLLHSEDADWPLIKMLLSVPTYKKMYLAHLHTIMNENFADDSIYQFAESLQSIINADVNADPYKFFTYSQYLSNLTADVSSGPPGPNKSSAPGIKALMDGRYNYLSSLKDCTNEKPVISNILPSDPSPELLGDVYITAKIINTNSNSVYLGYRYDLYDKFNKIPMYDDGEHGDGSAGDNVYGAQINVSSTSIQYYIYAENNDIGMFSPERAEHEFYSLNAKIETLNESDLVINELMAKNTATVMDPEGKYADWIELYNNTNSTLSLDNLYMSDTYSNLLKWKFPDGTAIDPKSYLIVWADEDLDQKGLHADFKLSANGENVILSYEDGTILDSVSFGEQDADKGYARIPNGTGNFVVQAPTFSENNESTVDYTESNISEESLVNNYPNPFNSSTIIRFNKNTSGHVRIDIYNSMGLIIKNLCNSYYSTGFNEVKWDGTDNSGSSVAPGAYFYSIQTNDFKATKQMILYR